MLPRGANSFLLRVDPFSERDVFTYEIVSEFLSHKNCLPGTKWQKNCRIIPPNLSPAGPGYVLPLQTVKIQISWLLKKPTDLDLHCLPLSM